MSAELQRGIVTTTVNAGGLANVFAAFGLLPPLAEGPVARDIRAVTVGLTCRRQTYPRNNTPPATTGGRHRSGSDLSDDL